MSRLRIIEKRQWNCVNQSNKHLYYTWTSQPEEDLREEEEEENRTGVGAIKDAELCNAGRTAATATGTVDLQRLPNSASVPTGGKQCAMCTL